MRRARASSLGLTSWVPSAYTTVGMIWPPSCSSLRRSMASGCSSMSTLSYITRWAARNFLTRLQWGHHGAP